MRGSDRSAPACNGEHDDRSADSSPATEHGRLLSLESTASFHTLARVSDRRRTTLTPLESELRFQDIAPPKPPGAWQRLRRRLRRERRPPKTLVGALVAGLVRLGIVVGLASAAALLVDHWLHRTTALGFYVVGGFVLAAAVLMSTGDVGTPYYYRQREREHRVRLSVSYVIAGIFVIAIGVAIEATR
jgi:hypothetical protein